MIGIAHRALRKPRHATPLRCQRVWRQTLQDMELVLHVITLYERAEYTSSVDICAAIGQAATKLKGRATWKVLTEADPWQLGLWKQVGLLSTVAYTATVWARSHDARHVHQLAEDFLMACGVAFGHVRFWMEGTGAIFESTDELLELSGTTIAELQVCVELLIIRLQLLQLLHPAAVWKGVQ